MKSDRSKVRCCKEQYCIGTWNVSSMNKGKLEVVKQETARVNVNILGISKLKWTGMGCHFILQEICPTQALNLLSCASCIGSWIFTTSTTWEAYIYIYIYIFTHIHISFSVIYFCLFILFMEFSRQEYWSGLPFPSSVDHILSEFSTMTHLSWVALHSMAHSSNELDKAVVHMISLISFLWLWIFILSESVN